MVKPGRRFGGALAVGAGIALSRIVGFVRDRVIGYYLGISKATGAFRAAMRIPNVLQNLFGEGVLSASFIPVYARLRAEGRDADAVRVARAVGTLLALVASLLALVGVVCARQLVDVIAPGFAPEWRELTIQIVRILFPGVALLVMSAWCLGILNSHRRFFLSYASPVLWSAALIATAIVVGQRGTSDAALVTWLAWGAVIGSAAQFIVQLPTALSLIRGFRPSLAVRDPGVQTTLRAFVPIFIGRGSVQLSAYIDQLIASYLGETIVAAMFNAQTLSMLPISMFGMAVSAAELPEMSSVLGDAAARAEHLQKRLQSALRRVVFLVVPSAVAFVAIGGPIIALLYQTGRFSAHDTDIVWIILAGSSIGISASTQSRLLGSAFYALGDPRSPLRAALVRVVVTASLGWALALPVRDMLGYSAVWGAAGLTASAGVAAWIELFLLRRWLGERIGPVPDPVRLGLGAFAAAALAGAAGFGAHYVISRELHRTIIGGAAAIAAFGIVYLGVMSAAKVPEAAELTAKVLRRAKR